MRSVPVLLLVLLVWASLAAVELVNVSYDPTREFYKDFNKAFASHWKTETGEDVRVRMSHGGSGKQARAVVDGLEADVVSLALAYDVDSIAAAGLIDPGWQGELPQQASPYTSTIVFVVRQGNPKGIKDWADLIKPGVEVVMPNPKASGGARWAYLAAWGAAAKRDPDHADAGRTYVGELVKHVKVWDSGARAATVTFAQRGIGDVLLSWENEAFVASEEFGKGKVEIVTPPVSILAEPPVAVVDKVAAKHGTAKVAQAYLQYLYSAEGQEIAARHHYRPRDPAIAAKHAAEFPVAGLFTVSEMFGSWAAAQKTHFDDGGTFDQVVDGKVGAGLGGSGGAGKPVR